MNAHEIGEAFGWAVCRSIIDDRRGARGPDARQEAQSPHRRLGDVDLDVARRGRRRDLPTGALDVTEDERDGEGDRQDRVDRAPGGPLARMKGSRMRAFPLKRLR